MCLECGIFEATFMMDPYIEKEILLKNEVKRVGQGNFDYLVNKVFDFQYENNAVYREYCDALITANPNLTPPFFMPIEAFKYHAISCRKSIGNHFFESSGTTAQVNSRHYVQDLDFYLEMAQLGFEQTYGPLANYCVLALLPHYLERQHSSLVAMVDHFISHSRGGNSGFFLNNQAQLYKTLIDNNLSKIPTILFGVSFALLDFVTTFQMDFPALIVMETGGMKGRREEMTKTQLHDYIKNGFNVKNVHSEYGMTELLSQAWSKGEGVFTPSSTLKVIIKEATDPMADEKPGKAGVVNIIDLANVETCSFIATQDLGIDHGNHTFSILGRVNAADLRGCNLMVE